MTNPSSNPQLQAVSPTVFAQRVAMTESLQLIDVREPDELEIVALPGFTNLPLSQFEQWAARIAVDFDPQAETYVLCHHGVRSAQMCYWLQQQGFTQVINIEGGIHLYTLSVDQSLPRY
ncbi:rhodanese [Picosynechococcus sp. PCC 73109]|uniref:rhodanese-like domain-containing protein n=2 Tax=Picosynechococcus sp. PCC 73109 TaxID=374982 RepID=UPI0007457EAA|nr:rhodanese-like domain-containing protein [Picosynechococcus sp. PCC 73109]AMA09633.1 rhodanese [Picosynechococcus sp. PCC 73109]